MAALLDHCATLLGQSLALQEAPGLSGWASGRQDGPLLLCVAGPGLGCLLLWPCTAVCSCQAAALACLSKHRCWADAWAVLVSVSASHVFRLQLDGRRVDSYVRPICQPDLRLYSCVFAAGDYCDSFLTHDSPAVRKQHNTGYKHKSNVKAYYLQVRPRRLFGRCLRLPCCGPWQLVLAGVPGAR